MRRAPFSLYEFAAIIAAILVIATVANADPAPPVNLHMRSPSRVVTDGGTELRLPAGYFVDEATHDKLDNELRRLQAAETKLNAENSTLRADMAGWQPGPYTLAITFVVGLAAGMYLYHEL